MIERPDILNEIASFINRWSVSSPSTWRRFRVALTAEEVDQLRTYFQSDSNRREFIWAIRGVPILVEEYPMNPMLLLERLEGWTND